MPIKPATHRIGEPQPRQEYRRPTANKRGYTHRWRKARLAFLDKNPLCVQCQADGLIVPATCVDHIIPHKGDEALFWDAANNWQAMCATCHSVKTAKQDGGYGHEVKKTT